MYIQNYENWVFLMAPVKVLFVIAGLGIGGAERILVNIVNRLDPLRFSPTVVSLSDYNPLKNDISSKFVEFRAIPRRWKYDLRPAWEIRRLLCNQSVKAVICFDFFSHFFVQLSLLSGGKSVPKVFIVHHAFIAEDFKRYCQTWIYTRLLRKESRVVCVCESQSKYLALKYPISYERCMTIYNGVDTEYFAPEQVTETTDHIRKRFGIPLDAKVILHVASFSFYKKHEDVLDAMKIIHQRRPDLKPFYLSVGGGKDDRQQKLQKRIKKTGIVKYVILAGIHMDVRPFYRIASCATLSSCHENFSVTVLEALAMGVPCVITDIGGAREIIKTEFNGLLVPPSQPEKLAEAWIKVIDSPQKYDRLTIRKDIVSRFSLRACVQNYEQILSE